MKFTSVFILSTVAAVALAGCNTDYVKVDTFAEAEDPVALTPEAEAAWDQVGKKLNASWVSSDFGYRNNNHEYKSFGRIENLLARNPTLTLSRCVRKWLWSNTFSFNK